MIGLVLKVNQKFRKALYIISKVSLPDLKSYLLSRGQFKTHSGTCNWRAFKYPKGAWSIYRKKKEVVNRSEI